MQPPNEGNVGDNTNYKFSCFVLSGEVALLWMFKVYWNYIQGGNMLGPQAVSFVERFTIQYCVGGLEGSLLKVLLSLLSPHL